MPSRFTTSPTLPGGPRRSSAASRGIYGLLRTAEGSSALVSAGNVLFTLLGFAGMYALLTVLALFLVSREIAHGPEPEGATG